MTKKVQRMAEILAIVASFLGPAIELGKCISEPIKRQLNYLCCFNNNIQNLREEAKKLEETRAGLQMRVAADENNAQVVVPQVKTWLEDATNTQAMMSEIETQITTTQNAGFTLKPRYSLSKKLKKTAEAMKDLRVSCDFNIISQPPPPAATVSIPFGSTYEFESRKHIEKEIMACLRDKEGHMVGICGMGGVGKTTMAKRIMHRVREEHLFEEIVMAVVSQKAEMVRIQDDIARSLGLNLGEGSLSSKAHTLRTRLTAGRKRSLIVLDDVWENLKLEELGIAPCESGCRVLLTSRDRNIFKRMNVDKVYAMGVLSETEAWHLFKSNVGSCIDNQTVVSVARQVANECKGLPIALVTVGSAMKQTENTSIWEDALQQLKSSNPIEMPEVIDDVYKPLRLSYELLKSERAKSLFLMCSLYHEDYNIRLEELAIYAMGLGMFEEITSLVQARNRVCSLVEMLKSRFLLLEGYNEDYVKMHDVVRDVSIFIASDEERIHCSHCTWRSPFTGTRSKLLSGSNFPSLRLLLIHHQSMDKELEIYDNFFEGMRELNVLSIKYPSLIGLPDTAALLKNLHTLVFVSCKSLESLCVVGELVKLEIFICRECDSIKSLPVEMGILSSLRLLEVSFCKNLKTIARGVISSLIGLEELVMKRSFDKWEAEVGRKKNAALSEVESLSNLRRLEIEIEDSGLAAENIRLSPNVVKYEIVIGGGRKHRHDQTAEFLDMRFEKKIEVKLRRDIDLGKWFHTCVGSAEYVSLKGDGSGNMDLRVGEKVRWLALRKCLRMKKLVSNISSSSSSSSAILPALEVLWVEEVRELEEICEMDGLQSNSFNNLKHITLQWLPKLHHLWKTSSTPSHMLSIFNNLSTISIVGCHSLRTLFSLPATAASDCFSQLERLEIKFCDTMEQVFLWEDEQNAAFPKLKWVSLFSLKKLTSVCKGSENIEFPVLEKMEVMFCPLLKSFDNASEEEEDDFIHFFCKPDKVRYMFYVSSDGSIN